MIHNYNMVLMKQTVSKYVRVLSARRKEFLTSKSILSKQFVGKKIRNQFNINQGLFSLK